MLCCTVRPCSMHIYFLYAFRCFSDGTPPAFQKKSQEPYNNHAHATTRRTMTGLALFVSLVIMIVNIFVLVYLRRLESIGCECAMDFRRTYIQVYLIISLINAGVIGLFTLATGTQIMQAAESTHTALVIGLSVWSVIMFIAGVVYIVFAMQYIHRLRNEKCDCSRSVTRDVWEVVLYIKIALMALSLLLLLLAFSMWGIQKASLPASAYLQTIREKGLKNDNGNGKGKNSQVSSSSDKKK